MSNKGISKKLLLGMIGGIVAFLIIGIVIVSFIINMPLSNGMKKDEIESAFSAGMDHYAHGDYKSAIESFLQVPFDSKRYSEAQGLLTKAKASYSEEIVDRVSSHISNRDFDAAFDLARQAQRLIPEDEGLKHAYEDVLRAYRSEVLDQVDSYALSGQYDFALAYLQRILERFPNDAVFQDTYNSTQSTYYALIRENAVEQADIYVADQDYENAVMVLRKALETIENDDVLTAKLDICLKKYEEDVLQRIDSVYDEGGYDAVLSLLKNASSVLPLDSAAAREYEVWKSRTPVALTSLTGYKSGEISVKATPHNSWHTSCLHNVSPYCPKNLGNTPSIPCGFWTI